MTTTQWTEYDQIRRSVVARGKLTHYVYSRVTITTLAILWVGALALMFFS